MNPWQSSVVDFHKKFGVEIGETPMIRKGILRAALIVEEALETCEAIKNGDLVESIDGIVDTIYVCLGTAISFGVDVHPFFNEVHRTNMLKVGGSIRSDGKILKPDGWVPPDIKGILPRAWLTVR